MDSSIINYISTQAPNYQTTQQQNAWWDAGGGKLNPDLEELKSLVYGKFGSPQYDFGRQWSKLAGDPRYGGFADASRFGQGNSSPIRKFISSSGKTYYYAPTDRPGTSMYLGPGGTVKIDPSVFSQGKVLAPYGDNENQGLTAWEFDPLNYGQYQITPGEGGGQTLKALAQFAPIAAAVLAPPLLAGLGAGATAGGGAASSGASSGGGMLSGSIPAYTAAQNTAAAAGLSGTGAAAAGAGGAAGVAGMAGAGGGGGGALAGSIPAYTAAQNAAGGAAALSGANVAPGLAAGAAGAAGGAGSGFLGSLGQAWGNLSTAQKISAGLGVADFFGRMYQSSQLKDIAKDASAMADPMRQPQRFPFQNLAAQYATGGQNIMSQPSVKAAYDLGMQDVAAKTSKFSDSGRALNAIALNSANVFNANALPYLDWLGTMGGFKQGPGYAGNIYGQYASQATGAPWLGVNSAMQGLFQNQPGFTGSQDTCRNFFNEYDKARRSPMDWNASVYQQG